MGLVSIIKTVLAVLVGALMIFAGANKLTNAIDVDTYNQLVAKFPLLHRVVPIPLNDYGITPDIYRMIVGGLEVAGGLLMLTSFRTIANVLLIAVMTGAVISDYAIQATIIPAAVILGSLVVIYLLPSAKSGKDSSKKRQ
eukprot:TRINITY_DN489_c0_g1_i2.p1 TRINITY_DN489_c0_g1~~TRINITY_DN489_c0_g1_i2.p1  ORF type:complete len:156 (+),score=27.31 TRINITY_DN489_c0_g1_i2:51-470(+)